jgi:hypothetical protein
MMNNEEALSFLRLAFPDAPFDDLQEALTTCENDVDKSIDWLLTKQALNNDEPFVNVSEDDAMACLIDLFPDTDERILHQTWTESQCRFDVTLDQLSQATRRRTELEASKSTPAKKVQRSHGRHVVHSTTSMTSHRPIPLETESRSDSIPATKTVLPPFSSEDLRARAQSILEARSTEFARATQAYKRGGKYGASIAGYYAAQARDMTDQLTQIDLMTAKRQVEELRGGRKYFLDLHGVKVKEALMIVEEEMSAWYRQERVDAVGLTGKASRSNFTIVTGIGRRSKTGARLMPAITSYLDREQWRYETDEVSGSFIVIDKLR